MIYISRAQFGMHGFANPEAQDDEMTFFRSDCERGRISRFLTGLDGRLAEDTLVL